MPPGGAHGLTRRPSFASRWRIFVTKTLSRSIRGGWALALGVSLLGMAASAAPPKPVANPAPIASPPPPPPPAYASTYRPAKSAPFAIVGANVFDGAGHLFEGGTVLVEDGKIRAAGKDIAVPSGWQVIDGRGKWVTPGVIDSHSHMGVFAAPGFRAMPMAMRMSIPTPRRYGPNIRSGRKTLVRPCA
jgi:hypothetical protein